MSGIDRSEYAKTSIGLIISYNKNEIEKIKYIIQYHQNWNARLREKLKREVFHSIRKQILNIEYIGIKL